MCGQCSLIDVVCFHVRIVKLMKLLNKYRAIWEEQKISHAPFVMLLSPRAFQLEHLLIFLEEMFSDERDRMMELVNQNFNWACWFCHRSFLPSPMKGTEELVCSWAHSLGSAQQAHSHYD